MITSEQIKEHRFLQNENGGYDTDSVDSYMMTLAGEYDRLFSENREIIKRLSVFAKKIEEYKNNEGVVADTLLTAQKTAAQTVAGAESVVKRMLDAAKTEGRNIISKAKADADEIRLERDTVLNEAQNTAKEIYSNASASVEKMFAEARKKSDDIVAAAHTAAEKTEKDAEENASLIIIKAEEKAAQIVAEAEAGADSVKAKATEDARNVIDESRRQVSEIRFFSEAEISRVKAEVETKKEELENEYRAKISTSDAGDTVINENAEAIIDEAKAKADEIIDNAKISAAEIIEKAKEIALKYAEEIRDGVSVENTGTVDEENMNDSPVVIITQKGIDSVNGTQTDNGEDTAVQTEETADDISETEKIEDIIDTDPDYANPVDEKDVIDGTLGEAVEEFSLDFSAFGEDVSVENNGENEVKYEITSEEQKEDNGTADVFNAMFDDIPEAEIDAVASFDPLLSDEKEEPENAVSEQTAEVKTETESQTVPADGIPENVKYDMFAGSVFEDAEKPEPEDVRFDIDFSDGEDSIDDIIDKFEIDFSSFEKSETEAESKKEEKKNKHGRKKK